MTEQLREQLQATLGRAYTLEHELGGGGMSRVFVAEEAALRRKVVVKVLPYELTAGVNVERFNREILVAAKLQHPHIVPVLSAGETQGLPFYTMPFVEGESLRARLGRERALSIADAVAILRDVAKALAYAHEHGIVHRDIKPDNVLLTGGSATVTDFGIAKAISVSRTADSSATLTQVGTSIGTPAYMAPEQSAGDPDTDHRADIYSFGCTAYELLAGQPPFTEKSPRKLLAAHMGETPRQVSELRPDTPSALAGLVMRCLAKEADDRPRQASDLVRELDSVVSSGATQAMPVVLLGGTGMLRKALLIYAASFGAVAILARAAIVGIGLPNWVFPGALIVMALGLPVVLWTGYVHWVARRAAEATPTFTPGGTTRTTVHGPIASMALRAAPHVSWYRSTRGIAYAVGGFVIVVAVFMGMRAFGIGPAATLLGSGRLQAGQPIILTDFSATNGDTSLARVVSFAVRTGLASSTVLTILNQATVASALERMKRPRTERVDLQLARDIASREGVAAIIDGEVTTVGNGYILIARILTADSARDLTVVSETGEGPEGLINAADRIARHLRDRAGESLRDVQQTPALLRATTASVDALRKFSEGARANAVENDFPKAARLLADAVAIDSQFASAWRLYSVVLGNLGAPRSQRDAAMTRAFQLRGQLPDNERHRITGSYYEGRGRDRPKAIAAYEQAPESVNLGNILHSRREFARAESLYRRLVQRPNANQFMFGNLVRELVSQGKLASADSVLQEAQSKFSNSSAPKQGALRLLYHRGDLEALERGLDSARRAPDQRDPSFTPRFSGTLMLLHGRLDEWRSYRGRALAADSAMGRRPLGVTETATELGVTSIVLGQATTQLKALDNVLRQFPLRTLEDPDRPDLWVAQQYAWGGRPDRARAILAQFYSEVKDTALLRAEQPAIHTTLGVIALAERKTQDAIAEFRRGDMAPDGPANNCNFCLPMYLALAFDGAGMADSAIVQYETYLRTSSLRRFEEMTDGSFLPGAHERLGQLYEAKGNAEKAAEHYRAFIALWENADPVLQPRVKAARERLYKLTPVERRRR